MKCDSCGHERFKDRCWACGNITPRKAGYVKAKTDPAWPGRIKIRFSPPGEIEATISITIEDGRALLRTLQKLGGFSSFS
jgi:hypothetical protein